jgi:hypothetical protein
VKKGTRKEEDVQFHSLRRQSKQGFPMNKDHKELGGRIEKSLTTINKSNEK